MVIMMGVAMTGVMAAAAAAVGIAMVIRSLFSNRTTLKPGKAQGLPYRISTLTR